MGIGGSRGDGLNGQRNAVFLDRDGVLNEARIEAGKPYPPRSVDEVRVIPGAAEALGELKAAGFVLIVVTNQPDVGRGTTTRARVEEINARLAESLPIDRFIVCYHDDADDCECRKPRPGMLLRGAAEFDISLPASYMVGDRWRDIEAGRAAGCKTVFIDYGYSEKQPDACDYRARSITDVSQFILSDSRITSVAGETE